MTFHTQTTLEISLEDLLTHSSQGNWYWQENIQFRIPDLAQLAVTANQLLKFENPVHRQNSVIRRFLTQQISAGRLPSGKLQKEQLLQLPICSLEWIYQQLWIAGLKLSAEKNNLDQTQLSWLDTDANQLSNDWLTRQNLAELNIAHLVQDDIELFSHDALAAMQSLYHQPLQGDSHDQHLNSLLKQHGFQQDLSETFCERFPDLQKSIRTKPHFRYWVNRKLSYPLPWGSLIVQFNQHQQSIPNRDQLIRLKQFAHEYSAFSKSKNKTPHFRKRLILVEGATETILLPAVAKGLKLDLHELGIEFIPTGGKNQVSSMYHQLAQWVAIPIVVLLDNDADLAYEELSLSHRANDQIYKIPEGELEDLYDETLIIETLNTYYEPHPLLTPASYHNLLTTPNDNSVALPGNRQIERLGFLWKKLELGAFDKVQFSEKLTLQIQSHPELIVTSALHRLINQLLQNSQ